uniref:Uncharacterized protein n=1 Tax=Arundo donax TaxID=35708 RepID=A0A0A9G7B7_ARUDO
MYIIFLSCFPPDLFVCVVFFG